MQSAPLKYNVELSKASKSVVYLVAIQGFSTRYSTGPVRSPLGPTKDLMIQPTFAASNITPDEGKSSVGGATFRILDQGLEITKQMPAWVGLNKVVTIYQGFTSIPEREYVIAYRGRISTMAPQDSGLSWEFSCEDFVVFEKKNICENQTVLTADVSATDTSIPVASTKYFSPSSNGHTFLQLDNELVAYSGTGNRVGSFSHISHPTSWIWSESSPAADNNWVGVASDKGYPTETWVAIANTGSSNRIMTSTDNGRTWTSQYVPVNLSLSCVAYGAGLWVVLAKSGTGNRLFTSPDGVTWTNRPTPADNDWSCICWNGSLFVAVASSGTGNRCMTSSDGITWTLRTTPADYNWTSVCWFAAASKFMAVASSGTGNRCMTSSDGITWTLRTTPADCDWRSVFCSSTTAVAVASKGTVSGALGNQVMYSTDGITWTSAQSAAANSWVAGGYFAGYFWAVANGGSGYRCMGSVDGITWGLLQTGGNNVGTTSNWAAFAVGNVNAVAVSNSGFTGCTRGVGSQTSPAVPMITTTASDHSTGSTAQAFYYLEGNVLDLFMQLVMSTGSGTNGVYDVLPEDLGLGIPASMVNVAAIEAQRNRWMQGYNFRFFINQSTDGKKFFEDQIFQFINAFQLTDNQGRISVHVFAPPLPTQSMQSVSDSNSEQPPTWASSLWQKFFWNEYDISYDWNPFAPTSDPATGLALTQYGTRSVFDESDSQITYGSQADPLIVSKALKSQGIYTDLLGSAKIQNLANRFLKRFAFPTPEVNLKLFFSMRLMEPGDTILVSTGLMPDPQTGRRGYSNKIMEVLSVQEDAVRGALSVSALDTRYSYKKKYGAISPSAKPPISFPNYTAATSQQRLYAFWGRKSGSSCFMSNGDDGYYITP